MDHGYCWDGNWMSFDDANYEENKVSQRNCEEPFQNPFSIMDSVKFLKDRQRNIFKIAVYYNPDQSVITKITKDAKMKFSDKISWVGGMAGLFTGFSLISGIEILYWLWFKILFHKKDHQVESSKQDDNADLKKEVQDLRAQVDELTMKMKASQKEDIAAGMAFDAIFNDPAAAGKRPWSAGSGSMFGS